MKPILAREGRLTKKTVAATFATVLLGFVVLSLAMRNSRPVLVRLPYRSNSVMGNYNWVVFNPFRDRAVERIASSYLEAMGRGDCIEASNFARKVALPNNYDCAQLQAEYQGYRHAFVQRLRDRTQSENEAVLYYSNNGYEGNWVTLRRFGSDWRVVEFNKFW